MIMKISVPITSQMKISVKKLVSEIVNKDKPLAVFVVGSFARGEASSKSDLDLLVVLKKRKSGGSQEDNIVKTKCNGKTTQIIYSSKEEIEKGIKDKEPFYVSLAMEAKPLYDPSKYKEKLNALTQNFSFEINLRARLDNAKEYLADAKELYRAGDLLSAKFVALISSYWLARAYINFLGSPYTMEKRVFHELQKLDPHFHSLFQKLWNSNKIEKILNCYKAEIEYIEGICVFRDKDG
jgi:predicted nucleotidyltransferase